MYNSLKGMLEIAEEKGCQLWEVILENEVKTKEAQEKYVFEEMSRRREIMKASVWEAIDNPKSTDGTFISGYSINHWNYSEKSDTLCGGVVNRTMAMALSASEVNAAMGKICAMPTAGSCGIVPAVLESVGIELKSSEEEIVKAYLTAAGVGAVVVENATVSGAEGGCQAECGVAAAMAAAAAVYLKGGSPRQSVEAFSLSLVNIMGLVCDPVKGYVQVPCAQRNASQAINALLSADLALAGMNLKIEPDEVIEAMYKVGKLMPVQHRETSLGGIAATRSGEHYGED